MQIPEPTAEHQFLLQLVGNWTIESTCDMGPDQPASVMHGKQATRALGALWTLGEMEISGPDGNPMQSLITLGYDPLRGKVVGSFIASCMTYLWLYEGELDQNRRVLTLNAEGPSFAGDGSMAKFQDLVEIVDQDSYLFSSQYLSEGKWLKFMSGTHRRVK